ncbi:YycH family regulatory protein [Cytobacillus sp. Hz8]|uniref:YycH family regulatory protein n=1 Tax=Cytobacillus sp. Hz8 TaxID=3347168 RepID=UPI0035DFCB61
MSYEKIKSVILAILVILSGTLTWSLWTYQPNYETIENGETVKEVSLSEKRDAKKIIKADRIFYHHENGLVGTINPAEIDRTFKELSRWTFSDFEDESSKIKNIPSFVQRVGMAEIIFPSHIPFNLYKNFLDIKGKDPDFHFDRIVIDVKNMKKEEGFVYFIDYQNQKVERSRVNSSFINVFKNNYYKPSLSSKKFNSYTSAKLTKKQNIYIRETESTYPTRSYLIEELSSNKFKNALFNNPSFVQKNYILTGEEYTDGLTLMRVNVDKHIISYLDPAAEEDYTINKEDLLQQSIDFVNNHGGWTDNFRYAEMDESTQTVLFRLYENNGLPVFSDEGMSEILQVWGQNNIYKYVRNNFTLDLVTDQTDKTLLSGNEVLEQLKKEKGFKPELLTDLVIGYTMSNDSQNLLLKLEPFWYYHYDNKWIQVKDQNQGGIKHGLE